MALLRQTLLLVLAVLFFLFWARAFLTGNRGYLAWYDMRTETQALESKLAVIETENQHLENKIDALDPQNPDLDYLSERVRQQSFAMGENEYLLIVPDAD